MAWAVDVWNLETQDGGGRSTRRIAVSESAIELPEGGHFSHWSVGVVGYRQLWIPDDASWPANQAARAGEERWVLVAYSGLIVGLDLETRAVTHAAEPAGEFLEMRAASDTSVVAIFDPTVVEASLQGGLLWEVPASEQVVGWQWDPAGVTLALDGGTEQWVDFREFRRDAPTQRPPGATCPACGFDGLFAPWDGPTPSDEICPCCGIQFGYDDADPRSRFDVHAAWRAKWLDAGARWWSSTRREPVGWKPETQLLRIGHER